MKTISTVIIFFVLNIFLYNPSFSAENSLLTLEETDIDGRFITALFGKKTDELDTLRKQFYAQEFPFNLNMVSLYQRPGAYIDYIERYKCESQRQHTFDDKFDPRISLSLRILEKFFATSKSPFWRGYIQNADPLYLALEAFKHIWDEDVGDIHWRGRHHPLVIDFIQNIAIPRLAERHLEDAVVMAYEFNDGRKRKLFHRLRSDHQQQSRESIQQSISELASGYGFTKSQHEI